jgi:hypothetical protein
MSTPRAILALFTADDVVLQRKEIIALVAADPDRRNATDVALCQLVKRGRLFRITNGQYARVATAPPISISHPSKLADLEQRVAELEAQVAFLLKSFVAGAA